MKYAERIHLAALIGSSLFVLCNESKDRNKSIHVYSRVMSFITTLFETKTAMVDIMEEIKRIDNEIRNIEMGQS